MPATTPVFSRHTRTMSPPLSFTPTITPQSQQQKLNVVTRLAIEGNAKQGESGAAIKMYLKISVPLDSVTPGSTIPLFPEENIKILSSQVHPIDVNSVPYNFSSTISPMLHNAARALMLPARTPQSYLSLFGLSPATSSSMTFSRYSSSPSSPANNTPPLEDKYTGHILVSGYHVSFVLPKEFPPRSSLGSALIDNEATPVLNRKRRPSVSEKNILQFMAAVEMMLPFLSRPPRAPFLLSIPTPRCLSNYIKLRIFPPSTAASSFASLSSAEEEVSAWDLTSDPFVQRTLSRSSRSNSYTHFADDESSDSSNAGFMDGCGIQGTFPSAERIRVRWAVPLKSIELPAGGDGRRKVGVREVKGEMTCVVLGKGRDGSVGGNGKEGVIMRVEYKGTCKGVWFPGVATLLGLDVGLLAKNSDVTWVNGMDSKWTVGGGMGFTGWDIAGVSPTRMEPSDPSADSPVSDARPLQAPRHESGTSAVSLLRAPLPAQNIGEYSFESSASSSAPTGISSSVGSNIAHGPNGTRSRAGSMSNGGIGHNAERSSRLPIIPITVHVNMNDLLPPSKNVFTFNIAGIVLVTPKTRILNGSGHSQNSSPIHSEDDAEMEPVVLPYFNVLAADTETTTVILRNDAEGSTVDVYNPSGDIREAQSRKTVLQKGGFTKCGINGERIAVRPFRPPVFSKEHRENSKSPIRPKAPNGGLSRPSSSSSLRQAYRAAAATPVRPKRDGPLMIPSVIATVTPLLDSAGTTPKAYAVRVCLPAPADRDSEWLEFGFAQPSPTASTVDPGGDGEARPPIVDIASVSLEGVPVRFETSVVAKQDKDESLAGLRLEFEEMSGKEWLTWVKVHVGNVGGGEVEINYICKEYEGGLTGKGKGKELAQLHVFLPAFLLPVGRLEVRVESAGLDLSSFRTNLKHQQSTPGGPRLIHYSAEELFYPRLSLSVQPTSSPPIQDRPKVMSSKSLGYITSIICIILLICLLGLANELRQMKLSMERYSTVEPPQWNDVPDPPTTVTVTSTVFAEGHIPWTTFVKSTSATTTISLRDEPSVATSIPDICPPIPSPESKALLVIQSLPFPWPLQFDFSPPQVNVTNVMNSLRKLWQLFRTVYHYPLPPP